MKNFEGKEYLTTLDIAKEYPVCDSTIRLWVKNGTLVPDLKILKRVYFLRSTLESIFNAKK